MVTRVRDRRYLVDEEKQMVFAATFFDHSGVLRKDTLVDGTTRTIGAPFDRPFTFLIFELFKVKERKTPPDRSRTRRRPVLHAEPVGEGFEVAREVT